MLLSKIRSYSSRPGAAAAAGPDISRTSCPGTTVTFYLLTALPPPPGPLAAPPPLVAPWKEGPAGVASFLLFVFMGGNFFLWICVPRSLPKA